MGTVYAGYEKHEDNYLYVPLETHHFTYLSGNSVCDFSPSRASPLE